QPGVGVAVAQMGQREQGLAAGIQPPPPRPTLLPVYSDQFSQVVEAASGQRDPGRVGQHRRAPWKGNVLGRLPSYREPFPYLNATRPRTAHATRPARSGWKRLTGFVVPARWLRSVGTPPWQAAQHLG